VIKKQFTATTLALFGTAALTAAQASQGAGQPPAPRPSPQSPAATGEKPTTTMVGCLYREDQIPGRKPNVAERAGVMEDYILADATMSSGQARSEGSSGATGTSGSTSAPGATGTSGSASSSGKMYKVESIPDERLKALVGKKVEVTGKIDQGGSATSTGAPAPDRNPGSPDDIELPEFEAASIREVSGTCPATPAAPRK
jgi:hypothetical protein